MIQIGLTGWGDHPTVYNPSSTAKEKLLDYSAHFPIVELDSTFYALYTWLWDKYKLYRKSSDQPLIY